MWFLFSNSTSILFDTVQRSVISISFYLHIKIKPKQAMIYQDQGFVKKTNKKWGVIFASFNSRKKTGAILVSNPVPNVYLIDCWWKEVSCQIQQASLGNLRQALLCWIWQFAEGSVQSFWVWSGLVWLGLVCLGLVWSDLINQTFLRGLSGKSR